MAVMQEHFMLGHIVVGGEAYCAHVLWYVK